MKPTAPTTSPSPPLPPTLPPPRSTPPPDLPQRQVQLEQLPLGGCLEHTRAVATHSLVTFGETFHPGWLAGQFHRLLAHTLEACLRRDLRRLIINVPPQHGKSLESSVVFPAWALTKFPTLRIFQAGHTQRLSTGFSRSARHLVTSERYRSVYPELINPRVNREDYWETKLGGYYYATSVGGGTGMPADVLIIDDPHKDRAEANSQLQRDRVWEWFTSTALTRLAPDGVVIIIQTRWHRDDLSGRLQDPRRVAALREAGFAGMNFAVLSLEALCESPARDPLRRTFGQALWPEKRNESWLLAQKLQITSFEWNALYQQRPNPPGGNLCDVKKVKIIRRDQVPMIELVRAWDMAISERDVADYSAGAYGGTRRIKKLDADNRPVRDPDGRPIELNEVYLVHLDRAKRAWPEQKAAMIDYATKRDQTGRVCVEAVQGWAVAAQQLREDLKGRALVQTYKPTKDKVTRALPWLAAIEAGNFYLVEGIWNHAFLDELEQFPNGQHDDQIDAVTVLWEASHQTQKLVLA